MSHATDGPGIDLTKQKIGLTLFIETEDKQIFELIIISPAKGVVKVSSTEERLKKPVTGILTCSFSSNKKTQINYWIGKFLRMSLLFKNGSYESKPVTHATIRGSGWSYIVF